MEDLYSCRALLDSLGMHQTKVIAKVRGGGCGASSSTCWIGSSGNEDKRQQQLWAVAAVGKVG